MSLMLLSSPCRGHVLVIDMVAPLSSTHPHCGCCSCVPFLSQLHPGCGRGCTSILDASLSSWGCVFIGSSWHAVGHAWSSLCPLSGADVVAHVIVIVVVLLVSSLLYLPGAQLGTYSHCHALQVAVVVWV